MGNLMATKAGYASKSKQRGVSILGILVVGGLVACLFVLGAQITPTFIEYQAIQKAARKAANEGNSVAEVRKIFDLAGAVDNIESVSGKDLDVTKVGDKIVVSFAYKREIHMFGPAYLLLKYEGRTK